MSAPTPPPGYAPAPPPGYAPVAQQPYYGPPPGAWQGYAVPLQRPAAVPKPKHSSHLKVIGLLVLVGALVAGVVVGVSAWMTPATKNYVCPPDCGSPPHGAPLANQPTFTGPSDAYSFEYSDGGGNFAVTKDSTGVTVVVPHGPTTMKIFGASAQGRTAQQVAHDVISASYPDARQAYVVPDAFVGYRLGYGEVDDVQLQGGQASYSHARLVVMVAVNNDVAVVATAIGPFEPATPATTGHPSGLGLLAATFLLDPIINTVRWRGDPPR